MKRSQELGGFFAKADFDQNQVVWETPVSTTYRGRTIYELPAPTQGIATIEMLNILEACGPRLGVDLAKAGPRSADYWHLMIEAKKLAYADLELVGDPRFVKVPQERLASKAYAASQCAKIDMAHARPVQPATNPGGGTVYITTADADGNMVSLIYSVFDHFGSRLTVPGYGFVLLNRGGLFDLNPDSPRVIAPGKRPFHTLIPGFVLKDGAPEMAFGLMGGATQAQGHAQVLVNMYDFGANLQAATDAARFVHNQANDTVTLESNLYDLVGADLAARGHKVVKGDGTVMGGYQAIRFAPETPGALPGRAAPGGPVNGAYVAGSDHRRDGEAIGY